MWFFNKKPAGREQGSPQTTSTSAELLKEVPEEGPWSDALLERARLHMLSISGRWAGADFDLARKLSTEIERRKAGRSSGPGLPATADAPASQETVQALLAEAPPFTPWGDPLRVRVQAFLERTPAELWTAQHKVLATLYASQMQALRADPSASEPYLSPQAAASSTTGWSVRDDWEHPSRITVTPAAQALCDAHEVQPHLVLERHYRGDWGVIPRRVSKGYERRMAPWRMSHFLEMGGLPLPGLIVYSDFEQARIETTEEWRQRYGNDDIGPEG